MSIAAATLEPSRVLLTPLSGFTSSLICTLAAVKAQPGVPSDGSADSALGDLIALACETFAGEAGLGRPIRHQRWQVEMPGDGGQFLHSPIWPINRIVSITSGVTDPQTVTATTYAIRSGDFHAGPLGDRDLIYRTEGWDYTSPPSGVDRRMGDRQFPYTVDLWGGWLMTDQVVAWTTGAKTVGTWVRPATAQASLFLMECTTAGSAGVSEPTWPTEEGETVTDGTVVWTARAACTPPVVVQRAAVLQVAEWYRGGDLGIPTGIRRERHGETEVWYQDDAVAMRELPALNPIVAGMLRAYR